EPPQPLLDGSIGVPVRDATPDFVAVPLVAADGAPPAANVEGRERAESEALPPLHDPDTTFNALAGNTSPGDRKFEIAQVEGSQQPARDLPLELAFAVALPPEPQEAAPARAQNTAAPNNSW